MKPFEQELTRIQTNLGMELNALAQLRDNHDFNDLQPVIEKLGEALILFNNFDENNDREGCHVCSKPLDKNNYQMVDGKKTCSSECAKQLKKQIINENTFG